MLQNQAILAGLRALVEQIDHLERQNAANVSRNVGGSTVGISAMSNRGSLSATSVQAQSARRNTATQSKAAVIAKRLGVSSRNFFEVAHAVGRDGCYAN